MGTKGISVCSLLLAQCFGQAQYFLGAQKKKKYTVKELLSKWVQIGRGSDSAYIFSFFFPYLDLTIY